MKKILWVLLDSRMGSVGQARGVVGFLDKEKYEIVEKNLEYTKLSGLPNFLRGKTLVGLTPDSKKQITGPFPDMVLSISRRTVPVARYIKKQNKNTKLIQLMHPGKTGLKEFDLVFANLSIHYFSDEDTKKLMLEIKRILKEDGLFIGSVNGIQGYEKIKDTANKIPVFFTANMSLGVNT